MKRLHCSSVVGDCDDYQLQKEIQLWMLFGQWVLIFLVFSLLKLIPMFLLPKLEYQTYYGVEALTESEVCQLWTESMLHSECLFYIGKFMS